MQTHDIYILEGHINCSGACVANKAMSDTVACMFYIFEMIACWGSKQVEPQFSRMSAANLCPR